MLDIDCLRPNGDVRPSGDIIPPPARISGLPEAEGFAMGFLEPPAFSSRAVRDVLAGETRPDCVESFGSGETRPDEVAAMFPCWRMATLEKF